MINKVHECAINALDQRDTSKPLVILSSEDDRIDIIKMVAVSLDKARCSGNTWTDSEGQIVCTKVYWEAVPDFPDGFELVVCNGGSVLSKEDKDHLDRWRKAAI